MFIYYFYIIVGSIVNISFVIKIENKNFNLKLWLLLYLLVIKINLNILVYGNIKKGIFDIMYWIYILLILLFELKFVDIK